MSFQLYIYIYIYIYNGILSPHEDGGEGRGGGLIFQDLWGVYLFIWTLGGLVHMGHMGGVTIRDFPGGGIPVPISCQIGKCSSIKVNLTNCHREVCKIKFYQIVTSDVLTSL